MDSNFVYSNIRDVFAAAALKFPLPEVWKVLVVDDDDEVQLVTKLVLSGFEFLGRPVVLLPAMSGIEAIERLKKNPDIAVAIIDVVMEREDSGLDLVKIIRGLLNNQLLRVILRTGQPGVAPERDIVVKYDINDYKEKTELTSQKLQTSLITALRSWKDLNFIEANRQGLQDIMDTSANLLVQVSFLSFTESFLVYCKHYMRPEAKAINLPFEIFILEQREEGELSVLARHGDDPLRKDPGELVKLMAQKALVQEKSCFQDGVLAVYFRTSSGIAMVLCARTIAELDNLEVYLLDIFLSQSLVAFDNALLRNELEETQNDLVLSLVNAIDLRSVETGSHVSMVAESARILGRELGLSIHDADILYHVAPMHDVGKVAIPDHILNKPGGLSADEMAIMRKHAQFGYELLHKNQHGMLRLAATVAQQHHERWDGSGYPFGIKGENINLYARIVSVVDVFDALTSDRIYKKAWPLEEAYLYIKDQQGRQFDPVVVEAFLARYEDIRALKSRV